MPQSAQTFARCTTDLADEVRPTSDFTAGVNLALEPGYVTGQPGNEAVAYDLPGAESRTVGACSDNAGGVLDFVANSDGQHQITRLDLSTGQRSLVLEHRALALSPDWPVLGAGVLDGQLVYLDANKELRSLPLDPAALATAVAALAADPYALHLVKQPPHAPPTASRLTNGNAADPRAQVNRVAGSAWQFAYQYEYPDGYRTPLGPYSAVLRPRLSVGTANNVTPAPDGRNFLRVSYPLDASPLVSAVRLVVRKETEAVWTVVGTMTAGAPLDFYGDTTGEVLTASDAAKLAESLPREVEAMTIAGSRVVVGNCVEGYATTVPQGGLTAVAVDRTGAPGGPATTPFDLYETTTAYTYAYTGTDGEDRTEERQRVYQYRLLTGFYPDPASTYGPVVNQSGVWYDAPGGPLTYAQAFEDFAADEQPMLNRQVSVSQAQLGAGPAPAGPNETPTFHERSDYPVGVAYFDARGRTAGAEAVTTAYIPRQDYANPKAQAVRLTLAPGVVPPAWATTYAFLLGPNRRASFFVEFVADQVRQYRGEKADGSGPDLRPIAENGVASAQQVWVSLTALLGQDRGYAPEPGDRLRFAQLDGNVGDFDIIERRAEYVAIRPAAVNLFVPGGLAPAALSETPVVEIYRPAPALATQVLYQRGPTYSVLNAGTPQAALSVRQVTLDGDVAFQPLAGVVEAMWPSTSRWGSWLDTSRGRAVALVPAGGRVRRSTLIRFTGVKVQGTRLNGLSQFDYLNQYEEVPQEQGAITALRVADQAQATGSILFVTQERGSDGLSLGRGQLQTADGTELLTVSRNFIGGANALRGAFGCVDPATVTAHAGQVFFYCRERAELVRYDRNGNVPLGETHQFRSRLQALTARHVDSRAHAGFDPRRHEYWMTFLPAAGSDLLPETLVFSQRRDAFADAVSWAPECAAGAGNDFVTWLSGTAYRHLPTSPVGTFAGAYTAPAVTFVAANPGALLTKTWQSIGVNSPARWVPTRIANALGQRSRILPNWLCFGAGVWRAALRRDEAVGGPQFPAQKLANGPLLQSVGLEVTLTAPEDIAALTACTVDFLVVSGQQPNT